MASDELSLETMLADPIVRDLMAADGVDSDELELQLRMVRDALARRSSAHSGNCFAELVKHFSFTRTNARFGAKTARASRQASTLESIFGQEPQCALITGTRSAGA
jgi:hypothetical protein